MTIRISNGGVTSATDDKYVKKAGDTMIGELIIDPVATNDALVIKQDETITADKKLYLDGS